jgi:hypothetical protein
MERTKAAAFFLSSSLRRSASLAEVSLPAYFWASRMTGLLERAGRSAPQMGSIRFWLTALRPAPPLFLMLSSSFSAMELEIRAGSTPTVLPPAASSAAHSCHVGTSWRPVLRRCQLASSCFPAWLK